MVYTGVRECGSRTPVYVPAFQAWQLGTRFAVINLRGWRPGTLAAGADPEYLCPARGARARCRRLAVLHGDSLGVRDLALASTLDAIGFHHNPPFLWVRILYT